MLDGAVPLERRDGRGRFAAGGVALAARRGAVARGRSMRGCVEEAVKAGVEFRPGIGGEPRLRTSASQATHHDRRLRSDRRRRAGRPRVADRRRGRCFRRTLRRDFYRPHTIHMATGRGGYVGLVRVEDDRLDVAAAFDPAFVKAAGGLGPAAGVDPPRSRLAGCRTDLADAPWKGTPALTRRPRARRGGSACSSSATRPGTSSRSPARGWPGR